MIHEVHLQEIYYICLTFKIILSEFLLLKVSCDGKLGLRFTIAKGSEVHLQQKFRKQNREKAVLLGLDVL
jgi:hypothetical protein